MASREKCNWIRQRVETPLWLSYSKVRLKKNSPAHEPASAAYAQLCNTFTPLDRFDRVCDSVLRGISYPWP